MPDQSSQPFASHSAEASNIVDNDTARHSWSPRSPCRVARISLQQFREQPNRISPGPNGSPHPLTLISSGSHSRSRLSISISNALALLRDSTRWIRSAMIVPITRKVLAHDPCPPAFGKARPFRKPLQDMWRILDSRLTPRKPL